MKFIVDAHLPKKLSYFLQEKGYDSIHTLDLPNRNASSDLEINGQPELQYYFHRPISELFKIGFKHGFIVNGIEEPVLKKSTNNIFSKVPPVMIVKMKLQRKSA
jgi:hypothetical protein